MKFTRKQLEKHVNEINKDGGRSKLALDDLSIGLFVSIHSDKQSASGSDEDEDEGVMMMMTPQGPKMVMPGPSRNPLMGVAMCIEAIQPPYCIVLLPKQDGSLLRMTLDTREYHLMKVDESFFKAQVGGLLWKKARKKILASLRVNYLPEKEIDESDIKELQPPAPSPAPKALDQLQQMLSQQSFPANGSSNLRFGNGELDDEEPER